MPISITGQLKVSTLQSRFLKEFGLTLRIYDGRSFADTDQTLAQVRKKKGSGNDLSVAKNMKVGNLEDKFEAEFGLKVQVAGSDDSYLCNNDLTLNQAQLEDEKKLQRKDRKSAKNASKNVGVDKAVAPDDVKSRPGNDNMFRVEVNPENGYKIRLIDDIDPKILSFSIDEINFYDDEVEDDVIVEIDGSKLEFVVEEFDEEANAYQIGFSGYLSAEINENEKSILKKTNYKVDYNLTIENDGEDFEQDESYELIHNSNIVLSSGDSGCDAQISPGENFKINGGWEKREGRAICRWIVVWKEISETSLAGALGGYSGGGTFQLEQFFAKQSNGKLTSLMIDMEDKITGQDIEFFDDVPEDVLETCDDAQDVAIDWHDQEEWEDADSLILCDEKEGELRTEGDMLLLPIDHNKFLKIILELAGVTAAPS